MTKRAPYFHVYIGLMVVFASYAMGVTMRVREARLRGNAPHGCTRQAAPPVSRAWKPVIEQSAGAICRLTGKISYVDEAGTPFRYDVSAYEQRGELAPDPNGPVFVHEFVGTGFHVGNGVVLTNQKVYVPAIGESSRLYDSDRNFFHITRLVASDVQADFPNQPERFQMKPNGFHFVHGVPEFTFELNGANVPALRIQEYKDHAGAPSGQDDRVGQKLLMLWQPVLQEADGAHLVTPTVAETAIGWNSGSTFLMKRFKDGQIPPPGAPILDESGTVIAITGAEAIPSGLVESEFDTSGIIPQMPIFMGETYGVHLYHRKFGFACNREWEQAAPAKKSRDNR